MTDPTGVDVDLARYLPQLVTALAVAVTVIALRLDRTVARTRRRPLRPHRRPPPAVTTLYRFYDPTGVLVYVGISVHPPRRFQQHARHQPWWTTVAAITLEHYPDRLSAKAAETRAIRAERPTQNIMENPHRVRARRWRKAA